MSSSLTWEIAHSHFYLLSTLVPYSMMPPAFSSLIFTLGIFCSLTDFCSSVTDGVAVRVECPGSENIPGIDEFLCSLDGGDFFGCKRDLGDCDDVFCDGAVSCFWFTTVYMCPVSGFCA